MTAHPNTVKPFHEKRRGRPKNAAVEEVAQFFRGVTKTRRSDWNHYYSALAIVHLRGILGEQALDDVKAGRADLPLPFTVLHALGTIPHGRLARQLTRESLRRRQRGERAHALAAWVRQQISSAAMRAAMESTR
jgi:hypothetical protein